MSEKHSFALKCVSFIFGQLVRNIFLFVILPKMAAAYGTIGYQHLPGEKLIICVQNCTSQKMVSCAPSLCCKSHCIFVRLVLNFLCSAN
jgi:hypothetical protein